MGRLLVLRPEPGASATVERARQMGLDAVAVPLFEIMPVAWEAPDASRFDGLLLTSANSVRWGGEQLEGLRALKVYAVGAATAEAAVAAGFDIAAIGNAGVDRLLASVDPSLKLLHLCGFDRRQPLVPQQTIRSLIVYRSVQVEKPDLARFPANVALIHSPEAARRFAELVANRERVALVAISMTAAHAAGGGWAVVKAASEPSDDALLALASSLCNKPAPK